MVRDVNINLNNHFVRSSNKELYDLHLPLYISIYICICIYILFRGALSEDAWFGIVWTRNSSERLGIVLGGPWDLGTNMGALIIRIGLGGFSYYN